MILKSNLQTKILKTTMLKTRVLKLISLKLGVYKTTILKTSVLKTRVLKIAFLKTSVFEIVVLKTSVLKITVLKTRDVLSCRIKVKRRGLPAPFLGSLEALFMTANTVAVLFQGGSGAVSRHREAERHSSQ